MTQEQREKLFQILGRIEGLAWAIDSAEISDGFIGVTEDLVKLLDEDAKKNETADEFIDRFLKENGKHENA